MAHCPHCEKPLTGYYKPLTEADAKALRSRDTGEDSQRARILAALRSGPKSTDDLRKLGIYQASARIWDLRHRYGYEIDRKDYDGYSADGYSHARMGIYTLVSEPLPLEAKPTRKGRQKAAEATNGGEAMCS